MNAYATALSSLALLMSSGAAIASQPALTTLDVESVREWVASRGAGGAEKKEIVEVDLVFNFMKGVGCTEAEAKAAAAAAAMKANELLKGACVKVNVKEVNNDWTGPGNQDDPDTPEDEADGEVNSDEILKAKKEGLKEVTGDDGAGGTKKGYKVFIVKDFVGDLDTTLGCTIKCEPWTAIQKNAPNITTGEILAHEIGHSFGKLDDTYVMDDMNCLMYGYNKAGSERKLKEGEGDKIRDGAKKHGRTVEKPEEAPAEAPKQPKPKATGGISKLESEPVVNPAGELVYSSFNAPFIGASDGTDTIIDFTVVRQPGGTAPTFIHIGVDMDSDPATGVPFGPWIGVEVYMQVIIDPFKGVGQIQAQDLLGGAGFVGPVMVMQSQLLPDEFLDFGAPPVVPLLVEQLQLEAVIPLADFPFLIGPDPALVQGFVSPEPNPAFIPLPLDDPFQFPIMPDDFFGRPIVQTPGLAGPGDMLPIDGFGFPPLVPVEIFIDDIIIGVANTDPLGQFSLPLPLPPEFFGLETFNYSFVSAKADPVGPAGTTWFEHDFNPCPADFNGDGTVDASDLAELLAAWGPQGGGGFVLPDLNLDHVVDASDLAVLLASWGPCP